MTVHTHAHPVGSRHGPVGRKAIKLWNERLRRDRRELVRELQERAARECYPLNEVELLPRID